MIRVALAQYQPAPSPGANLNLVGQIVERVGQEEIDIVCFGRDFLGFGAADFEGALGRLRELAADGNVEMVTGRVGLPDGSLCQTVLIGRDGAIVDSVPDGEVKTIRTQLGPTLVLSEAQAYSNKADELAVELRPKAMIMQANAISLLELEAIKELAVARSFSQAHLVLCVSAVGRLGDENALGASLAVLQGQILAEAETGVSELLIFSVDPARFIDYDELRDHVTIPELLKQKYSPQIHHDSDTP